MKKRRSRAGVVSETEFARVEIVKGKPSEPLSIDEVRQANEEYFAALCLVVGPVVAKQAFDDFLQQIEEASAEVQRRGDACRRIRVTRLS